MDRGRGRCVYIYRRRVLRRLLPFGQVDEPFDTGVEIGVAFFRFAAPGEQRLSAGDAQIFAVRMTTDDRVNILVQKMRMNVKISKGRVK